MLGKQTILLRILFVSLFIISLSGCEQPADNRPLPGEYSAKAAAGYALPVTGAHNFRDLGGYKTIDGRELAWGKLYRSSRLSSLTDKDLEYLHLLNIGKIYDFRSPLEKQEKPDILPTDWSLNYIEMPINPGDNTIEYIKQELDLAAKNGTDLSEFMINLNRDLVLNFTPVYREWLSNLAEGSGDPVIFHCTAGKDRAGFAAATLLLALGVPYQTVMNDYLLSNTYSKDYIKRSTLLFRAVSFFQYDEAAIKSLLVVKEEYLGAAMDTIITEYGSVENYLENGLGVDSAKRRQLRSLYLL